MRTKTRRPLELADELHADAARFLERSSETAKTDCESGCAYCCHQPATAFAFEAIRIADFLKESLSKAQLDALKEKMKSRVSGLVGASVRKSINDKTACPLLTPKGECMVYEHRPLTCRLAHSFSVKKCSQAFQKDRTKVEIPVSLKLLEGIGEIIEGVYEQLPRERLDGNLYELCSVVLKALADSNAATKWAKGDLRVFADCVRDDT